MRFEDGLAIDAAHRFKGGTNMSWEAVVFLIQYHWLYLLIALAIGIVTGWVSASERAE